MSFTLTNYKNEIEYLTTKEDIDICLNNVFKVFGMEELLQGKNAQMEHTFT